jgi:hypothetical protein
MELLIGTSGAQKHQLKFCLNAHSSAFRHFAENKILSNEPNVTMFANKIYSTER